MPRNPAIERLQHLSSHLASSESLQAPTMPTQARDPITCHVLDTTTGRPAANMAVKLFCLAIPDIIFNCKTDADGRIGNWKNSQGANGEEGAFATDRGGVPATLHYMIRHYAEVGVGAGPSREPFHSSRISAIRSHYSTRFLSKHQTKSF